ncbi:hypothetical protein [Streptomyces sp. NPDC056061]|uniref:hypothetical protein n=1 Tax=Streptomyces sp. NPDC056061 TaxID=3345700 RepID=UPI0035E2310A
MGTIVAELDGLIDSLGGRVGRQEIITDLAALRDRMCGGPERAGRLDVTVGAADPGTN